MDIKLFSFSAIVLFSLIIKVKSSVKECSQPLDYFLSLIPLVPTTCRQDPDGFATPTTILQRWGCTVEEVNLTTIDGYIFLIIRAYKTISSTTPIIMAHGIYTNSRSFLSMYNLTLAYNLIQNGNEIYFIFFRGTIYTPDTTNGLTQNDYAYWNYSFHHLGIYEICQTVDYVFNKTNQKSIVIGYSMGTSAIFVCASLHPENFTSKTKGIVALAPVAILNTGIKSILGKLAPFWKFIQETRPINFANNPDSICENLVTHYSQIIESGIFQQFDFGTAGNVATYGTSTPPMYPLENITSKVVLVVGKNDWLATPETSILTWNSFTTAAQCKFVTADDDKFTHDEFITSKKQYDVIYKSLLSTIANLENGSCA